MGSFSPKAVRFFFRPRDGPAATGRKKFVRQTRENNPVTKKRAMKRPAPSQENDSEDYDKNEAFTSEQSYDSDEGGGRNNAGQRADRDGHDEDDDDESEPDEEGDEDGQDFGRARCAKCGTPARRTKSKRARSKRSAFGARAPTKRKRSARKSARKSKRRSARKSAEGAGIVSFEFAT